MYYIRHYVIYDLQDEGLLQFLDHYGVQVQILPCLGGKDQIIVFDISENMKQFSEIEPRLPLQTNRETEKNGTSRSSPQQSVRIDYYPTYTESERMSAKWLCVRSIPMKIAPVFDEPYWEYTCYYATTKHNIRIGRHEIQTKPIEIRSPVKWGRNFFSTSLYDSYFLFCNDMAKSVLLENNIKGIAFNPVLKRSTKQPIDNLHQLSSSFEISDRGIVPLENAKTFQCEHCGMELLQFENGKPLYGIREDCIIEDVDFIQTPPMFLGIASTSPVGGHTRFIISQKMYSVLHSNCIDRNLVFTPLKTI